MSDLYSSLATLANRIEKGKCSVSSVRKKIEQLENKYGDWDMPVALPDKQGVSNNDYVKTLSDMIHSGVYSKEALYEMARCKENDFKCNRLIVITVGITLFIMIVFVFVMVYT